MFELESRYQEYERVLLAAECLKQDSSDRDDIRALRGVRDQIRMTLERGREATGSMLLDRRDEVFSVGSVAVADVRRYLAHVEPSRDNSSRNCAARYPGE